MPAVQSWPNSMLPWPLPAVLAWAGAWGAWALAQRWVQDSSAAVLLGSAVGAALALAVSGPWRRALCALGFPLSAWAQGAAAAWPLWAWPLLLGSLLLAYPLRAWRDAPFFPTPANALQGLDQLITRPNKILDVGCGLGHGLRGLRRLWPQAHLCGVEWSPVLAWMSRLRCPWARVERGDMWGLSWSGYDLVYVFQRPESMDRVWAKARAELAPSAWLVSLEFGVPGRAPTASLTRPGQRVLWIYRMEAANPASTAPGPGR